MSVDPLNNTPPLVKSSPKDVFLHGLLIVTLYMSVISFITLCFQYINILLPDPLTLNSRATFNSIRWGSSILIVAFPVFLWLSRLLEKEFRRAPAKHDLPIRKWLVYLTLFITAIVIIVDLIILIYNFYGGDLTAQFALKILVVLVAAAAVFGYYLWDLRRPSIATKIPQTFAWASLATVLIALIAGIFIGGSPAYQRQIRFDEQRVEHLQSIQSQVVFFWSQKGSLPSNLTDLQDSISGFSVPRDPDTGVGYEYTATGDLTFELCATFSQPGGSSTFVSESVRPVGVYDIQANWQHEAGRTCFERTIDPELHKSDRQPF